MSLKIGFNARVLADPAVRGLARYTVNLLRALSQRGDAELALFSKEPLQPAHLDGISARVIIFDAPRESVWNDWDLPRRIRREGIQVFHAPADRGLPLPKPCPMVVTIHGSYERAHWRKLFPTAKDKLWYWKNEWLNRLNADAILTVSDTAADEIARLGIAARRKLSRVYLAAGDEFRPDADSGDAAVLERHGVRLPYLLYVGGYDQHKNVDVLIRAFDQSSLPHYQLVVVARHQWNYPVWVEKWRTLRCFPRLRLIEAPCEELPAFYRQAEFFVNPSLWESFSLQTLEAMASGTPTLASNRKAIPEIAGEAALFFDPEDVVGLSRTMEKLASDHELRRQLRERGLRRAHGFSWHACAEETLNVYRRIAAQTKQARCRESQVRPLVPS